MKRRTKHIILLVSIPTLTMLLFVASNFYHNGKEVEQIRIKIDAEPDNMFLGINDVRGLLSIDTRVLKQPVKRVNLLKLERELMATQYVDTTDAYFGPDGLLIIKMKLRKPVVRVLPNGMDGYYLDDKGMVIPLSNTFTARVPILTGNVPDLRDSLKADSTMKTLLPMLNFMSINKFWAAHTSELFRNTHGDLIMYPTAGNIPIQFGGPYDYEKKFRNLLNFYTTVLKDRGWNYYKSIAVKYDGQIVATKK